MGELGALRLSGCAGGIEDARVIVGIDFDLGKRGVSIDQFGKWRHAFAGFRQTHADENSFA